MPRERASVFISTGEDVEALTRPDPDTPFHILVAGDFTGGAGAARKAIPIDRDTFEAVFSALSPVLEIPFVGAPLRIEFREFEDFHPDRLFERLPPFQALGDLRRRLSDPATFAAAAAEMAPPTAAPSPTPLAGPPPDLAGLSGADILNLMMGEAPAREKSPDRCEWDQLLHDMVAQYAQPRPDPRQPELIAQADAAITGFMRVVLHHPLFQSLESNWRALDFLVRRLETGEDLKMAIVDMPHAEAVSEAGLAHLRRALAAEARAVIAALYYFSPAEEPALLRLAALARSGGAPLIGGLAPDVVGLTGVFSELRRSPDARWMGLALPRFLLRLPYGRDTSEADTFDFEEMPVPAAHERYLWGNPAAACACLLGEAFTRQGWAMLPGAIDIIEGLPLHVYQEDGESVLKPCAEVHLTEESATLLLERGFMPLVSIKGADRVRLLRFQSVADPLAPLAGRWKQ
ncbi:MAG TPA: type VI secretion system contractile sheath large subunit [Bryobacteraceae bacterium]|nr:type VI secretion system contractile sheath large subunit [Bryobacteraceae bacterium]